MIGDNPWPVRTLVILVFISGVIFGLDSLGGLRFVKGIVEFSVAPLRQVSVQVVRGTSGVMSGVRTLRRNQARIADLERQVAQLTVEAERAKILTGENEALRKLTNSTVAKNFLTIPAKVVGLGEELLVVAESDGVEKDNAVITEEGVLVGTVYEIGEFITKVKLTTHPTSKIEVRVGMQTGGVAVGEGQGKLMLEKVLQSEDLSVGMIVTTSGEADRLPAGLVIGKVERVREGASEVYKSAIVKPLFSRVMIDYVFILTK